MAAVLQRICLIPCRSLISVCSRSNLSAFRSSYSLDKVYPNSRLDITTIPEVPKNVNGGFSGYIPLDQIEITYSRSSGPGGQNVNCVSTKTEIRFHLATANWIPGPIKEKLIEQLKNQLTKDGYFVMKSDRTRSQQLNLADALDKLRKLIHHAANNVLPKEASKESLERQRRLRERAARERLKEKRLHSMTKQGRQAPIM